ncbi:transcription elongation factor SPT5 isoform X1 [Vigna unguiculata]|uniref:transcription elongation factor SPT5 isoform X1 n=1 Tax=Vigna unguiculata TaxID=3917 RepID=UPI0010160F17|nr:transcription elongation factor SPT5 isoform X1 [Vigna unguiculata]XP_027937395.1 transcription elongation factor SPT5 isoform X1 [Vigna unguiculata]
MGCFMACFGLSNKRKRRKTLYKVLAGNQRYGNYEVLAITEKSTLPDSDLRDRDKVKEQNSNKSRKKKVTFNLNVQVYEPNPTAYQVLNNEEDEDKNSTAESESSRALPVIYPTNHRYYNCEDGHGEEDEMAYEDSDIDDYDDDDEFDDDEYDWDDGGSHGSLENYEHEMYDENPRREELSESCYRSMAEDKVKNQMPVDPNHAELKPNLGGRERSMDMHSVLSPVENLTQWKAMKTKVAASSKHRRKENVPSNQQTSMPLVPEASLNFSPCRLESNALQSKPLLPDMAVDASLSNWVVSPNYHVSSTTIHCQ